MCTGTRIKCDFQVVWYLSTKISQPKNSDFNGAFFGVYCKYLQNLAKYYQSENDIAN